MSAATADDAPRVGSSKAGLDAVGGFDPQAVLTLGVAAFGVGAFAFGHLAAAVQDLIDLLQMGAAVGIDGEGVAGIEALTAAVADGPAVHLAGEVQPLWCPRAARRWRPSARNVEDALGVDAQRRRATAGD